MESRIWSSGCLLVLTLIAAVADARRGEIPNWLTLPALALVPLAHGLRHGPSALLLALLCGAACAALPLWLWRRGAMGGGDVKLFAAIGTLLGATDGLGLQLASYVLASVAACGRLAYRGELRALCARVICVLLRGRLSADERASAAVVPAVRLGPAVFVASAGFVARAAFGV